MPGGGTDGVLVEKDEKWLKHLKKKRPDLFERLENIGSDIFEEKIDGIAYWLILRYMAI